jgi:hypothetical protein
MRLRQRDTTASRRSPDGPAEQVPNSFIPPRLSNVSPFSCGRISKPRAVSKPRASPWYSTTGEDRGAPGHEDEAGSCNGLLDSNRCDLVRPLERRRHDRLDRHRSRGPPRLARAATPSASLLGSRSPATRHLTGGPANNHDYQAGPRCPLPQPPPHPPRSRSPIRSLKMQRDAPQATRHDSWSPLTGWTG